MNKLSYGEISIKDIKYFENSRLREKNEVGELMEDIKQHGLLQAVGIRKSDNVLMFGNRRVRAFELLGYNKISCVFYDDVSDDEILIINLVENINRKKIGSIEIGRLCKLLINNGMTKTEIAQKLSISKSRVEAVISAYDVTVGTSFEKIINFGKGNGISETVVWRLQTSLTRARNLTKQDWEYLLLAVEKGEISLEHISRLRNILLSSPKLSIPEALKILKKCKIIHCFLCLDIKELGVEMKKHKHTSEREFIRSIIEKYNGDLLF